MAKKIVQVTKADRDSEEFWTSQALVNPDNVTFIDDCSQIGWSEEIPEIKTEIFFIGGDSILCVHTKSILMKKFEWIMQKEGK